MSPVKALDLRHLSKSPNGAVSTIVSEFGKVYVTAITRDGCSGCEEQKPLFEQLAQRMDVAHGVKVAFSNIHVQHVAGDLEQSEDAKRTFGHGSYPTYMVHVKSKYGPLEHYRAAYPSMGELEKQIVAALELAEHYKNRAET